MSNHLILVSMCLYPCFLDYNLFPPDNTNKLPFGFVWVSSQVRNSATGAEAVVRIVDECHQGGLDLEEGVFASLDTDGQGNAQGHMITEYEFVDCAD